MYLKVEELVKECTKSDLCGSNLKRANQISLLPAEIFRNRAGLVFCLHGTALDMRNLRVVMRWCLTKLLTKPVDAFVAHLCCLLWIKLPTLWLSSFCLIRVILSGDLILAPRVCVSCARYAPVFSLQCTDPPTPPDV